MVLGFEHALASVGFQMHRSSRSSISILAASGQGKTVRGLDGRFLEWKQTLHHFRGSRPCQAGSMHDSSLSEGVSSIHVEC